MYQINKNLKLQKSKTVMLHFLIKITIFLNIIFTFINSKFVLQTQSDHITIEALIKDPYIQVQGKSKQFNIDEYDITHLKLIQTGKNKRKTYENFVKKYKKITTYLIKNQIIPHQTAMIHSSIQMNFLNKKRIWQFSRMFVIYSDNKQLDKVLKYLQPLKVTKLKQRLLMGYLNEKLIAIKAFTAAKSKLEKFLRKKMNSNLEIVYVKDIQIEGRKFLNEQDIQAEIKNQNNYSKQQGQVVVPKNDPKTKQRRQKQLSETQLFDQDITMRVVFKVGQNSQQSYLMQQDQQDKSEEQSQQGEEQKDSFPQDGQHQGEEL